MSDNEKLIQELKAGFASLVYEQQEIRKAITDSKPKPPTTTDKKTTFWNGYMIIANEYDKEFLQKYGTDLDTSLIFAGLFSAVASAFIIQIQPEFESTAHPLTVVAQSLLYISLGSTLLAALLAVLGKQWLMYYSAAGERGTIESRGLERQRKLDGLQKWKFELIMQAFPLLLQFGLFLFAAALSVYLWKIHHILAGIVLGITAAGTIAYLILLASAIFFKDSPFQTPLAPFLRTMLSCISTMTSSIIPKYLKVKVKETFQDGSFVKIVKQHIPAVCWVLESSTDPIRLAEAADMSIDLQWPLDMELPLDLHLTQFLACFEYHLLGDDWCVLDNLRDGMNHCASQFGQAYMLMQWFESTQSPNLLHFLSYTVDLDKMLPELALVLSFICENKSIRWTNITQPWLLRCFQFKFARDPIRCLENLVAELDSETSLTCASFSEYLFVVYSCLVDSKISSHDVRVADKSAYGILLYEEILKTLPSKLKSRQINMQLTADVLKLTLQLASNCRDHREWDDQWRERQLLTYKFCQALPQTDGWIQVICIPGLLPSEITWSSLSFNLDAESWIYHALRHIPSPINEQGECEEKIVHTLNILLCALYNNEIPPYRDSLELLVQLLSLQGDVSNTAAWLLLQKNVHDWYTDSELGPKLRDHSVWALLSTVILKNSVMFTNYIDLAYLLSTIPEWQPYLETEKCCWIHVFSALSPEEEYLEKYNAVFKTIWTPGSSISTQSHLEEAIGLVCDALSKFWASFDLAAPLDTKSLFAWLECSNSAIFHENVQKTVHATQLMKGSFIPLQSTLLGFLAQIQNMPSENSTPMLAACGKIVRDLATKMLQTEIDSRVARRRIDNKIKKARKLVVTVET
ncbi:hypothetical protein R3P38DRAFT_2661868 [Favolaschia claudopus]|uniref:DUF6535 domain-containing protein n=1 Tax=Favolaschia claudopus TaxID=2862362 RepID=A0AAV9ZLJ4_9AGAR